MSSSPATDLAGPLRGLFHFSSFRPLQEDVVRLAVGGRDTLAVMPTGAGKSLCYQLAAMLRPEPTLVLSPLIALMKDQVEGLPPAVAPHATLLNSSVDGPELTRRLSGLGSGAYKLIYAAPERLRQRGFVSALKAAGVGLVVVDEAHCVSMWGHDFRPDYLFIRTALEALGHPHVLALTATATPSTARDIATALGRDLETVRGSVVRPNLRYEVRKVEDEEERKRATVEWAEHLAGSGIIYARAREKCEDLALMLRRHGLSARHYHAGMDPQERNQTQEAFIEDRVRIIVATTAFGMGIDKPDIRGVLLYNFPNSVESYVQMVGRAGRDGQLSECVLLTTSADAASLRRFASSDIPTVEGLRAVYRAVRERSAGGVAEVAVEDMRGLPGLRESDDPRVLVGMLERAGLVRRDFDLGRAMQLRLIDPPADTAQRIASLLEQYRKNALERAHRMIAFADARRCRHRQVAEHFGETLAGPCGRCDVCDPRERRVRKGGETSLPADIAGTILDAVGRLPYPLGLKGLVATLKGSIDAPPTARRSDAYGILSAATGSAIKRWVEALIASGNLEWFEKDEFRLLGLVRREGAPHLLASPKPAEKLTGEDGALFERLRVWRAEKAHHDDVPPYVVLSDRSLKAIAVARPRNHAALAQMDGIGPVKLEKYGAELLEIVRDS